MLEVEEFNPNELSVLVDELPEILMSCGARRGGYACLPGQAGEREAVLH